MTPLKILFAAATALLGKQSLKRGPGPSEAARLARFSGAEESAGGLANIATVLDLFPLGFVRIGAPPRQIRGPNRPAVRYREA